jgi:hypothetical protein
LWDSFSSIRSICLDFRSENDSICSDYRTGRMPTDWHLISSVDLLYFLDHLSVFYMGCDYLKVGATFMVICSVISTRGSLTSFIIFCRFNGWCIYREESEFSFVEDLIWKKHTWRKVLLSCSESVGPTFHMNLFQGKPCAD